MDQSLMYWIEKGGAFGVIALLLYFYRRDWTTLTQYWQQQNTLLMEIVRTNTAELGKVSETIALGRTEARADAEAIRSRLHEIAQPLHALMAEVEVGRRKDHL